MARKHNTEQAENREPVTVRLGGDVDMPVMPSDSEVRSLPGMEGKENAKVARDFLTDKDGELRYTSRRFVPATLVNGETISGLDDVLRVVTRAYNTLQAMAEADGIELPRRENGEIVGTFTHSLWAKRLDDEGNEVDYHVAPWSDVKIPEGQDPVGYFILDSLGSGIKLQHQREQGKVEKARAIADATIEGVLRSEDGTAPKKGRTRETY